MYGTINIKVKSQPSDIKLTKLFLRTSFSIMISKYIQFYLIKIFIFELLKKKLIELFDLFLITNFQ